MARARAPLSGASLGCARDKDRLEGVAQTSSPLKSVSKVFVLFAPRQPTPGGPGAPVCVHVRALHHSSALSARLLLGLAERRPGDTDALH